MARLRFSLALMFLLFLLGNIVLVTLAALASRGGNSFSLVPEDVSTGLRLLILVVVAVAVWGGGLIVHRQFLEAGISPVDTTAGDLAFMAYFLLTAIVILFLGDSSWAVFAFLLVLLFIFTVIILKRLLVSSRQWLVWIVSAVALAAVTVVLTLMMFGGPTNA